MFDYDNYFLNVAFDFATEAQRCGGQKVCALVVIKKKIVSVGFNSGKNHPIAKRFARDNREDLLVPHAETRALLNASKKIEIEDFRKATVYVARATMTGDKGYYIWGLAKPCNGCHRAISFFGVKRVVYTCNNEKKGCFNLLKF